VAAEQRDNPGVIAPPPLIFAIPLIAGIIVGRAYPFQVMPRPLALAIGGVLAVLAIALNIWAVPRFSQAGTSMMPYKPTTAIISSGPFAITRNPVYLAMTLLYLGITLLVNTVWPLVLLPFVLFAMQRGVIEREERYLERKFGDEYTTYKSGVRRWL
jgi:protein-S-isoprenylcysteine O-methyltransferase Ste14